MVVCIIAFIVFAFLGIFSIKYRELAREAFACVLNTVTLRPCTTGFDNKLKTRLSISFTRIHPKLGKILFQNFKTISLIFTILLLASLGFTVYSLYNLIAFGNCSGQTNSFCVFKPETYNELFFWQNNEENIKPIQPNYENRISFKNAKIEVIEAGCFACPFTRKAAPYVKKMLADFNGQINFSFHYFPLPSHAYSFELAEAAECGREQGRFWEVHDALFIVGEQCSEKPIEINLKQELNNVVESLKLNKQQFTECIESKKFSANVERQKQEAINAGIYGTPTFFINEKVLVSPQSYEELKQKILEELESA